MERTRALALLLAASLAYGPALHGSERTPSLIAPLPPVLALLSVQAAQDPGSGAGTVTVVLAGEDLYAVARRLLGDDQLWTLLWQFNRDALRSPDDVREGMRLRVPPYRRDAARPTPPPRTDPATDAADRAGGITTRSPGFASWFDEAVAIARKTWKMPRVVNRYGQTITEEDYLKAILFIESRGVHRAGRRVTRSHAGALGFMQLMPGTARGLGVDPADPRQNLTGGARYLAECFASKGARVAGDSPADQLAKAAAAYNTGPGRRALAANTWTRYVGVGGSEPVYYGIQLKMALGLDLNATEQSWLARHKGVSPGEVRKLADDVFARSKGVVNA